MLPSQINDPTYEGKSNHNVSVYTTKVMVLNVLIRISTGFS